MNDLLQDRNMSKFRHALSKIKKKINVVNLQNQRFGENVWCGKKRWDCGALQHCFGFVRIFGSRNQHVRWKFRWDPPFFVSERSAADVEKRQYSWGSTLMMLNSIIKNNDLIVRCLQNIQKYDLILEDEEVIKCKEMSDVLQHFSAATKFLHGQSYPTINTVYCYCQILERRWRHFRLTDWNLWKQSPAYCWKALKKKLQQTIFLYRRHI